MTYYQSEVARLNEQLYSSEYVWKRIGSSKKFIDKHYAEPLDLESISNHASMTKFHFIRLFKLYYGRTPHQYLIGVRIEEAKKMLAKGATVCAASAAVGFESVTSFASLFKKLTGSTPSSIKRLP